MLCSVYALVRSEHKRFQMLSECYVTKHVFNALVPLYASSRLQQNKSYL